MSRQKRQFSNIIYLLLFIPFLYIIFGSEYVYAAEKSVNRISGSNRYETAIELSREGWPNGAQTVMLAVGDNFPDALAGAPLAYQLNAPILLTNRAYLPADVSHEIRRLGAKHAILLGGESVISKKVASTLQKMGLTVERINGRDRYETTIKIAERLTGSPETAIIAYGNNFPDSLAIASYASKQGYPILLTEKHDLPEAIKQFIKRYKNTIVIGGEGVISKNVMTQLPSPIRISGNDRYGTAAKVVEKLHKDELNQAYVATGAAFADALTGSVLAAKNKSLILLVENENVPADINKVIDEKKVEHFAIIGGESVVSNSVVRMLQLDIASLISTAKSFIGVPYVWGGTTPAGFDCSGYLNYVYEKHGINLPRTVADIWKVSKPVSSPAVGDIVFFETYKPGPSHAGIYIGDNQFIHASSSKGVEITSINSSYYKTRYLGAKRVF
ncbi:cell wall-binding repeat-containing protein [Bacillus alveayuensis]|uniref:cell wall-binding repeat-containing protein n=1 Tax=Aeribacillus alveayuensis TaxID=279215 RepID=UPI0005CD9C04|nr:cell wall-binding repeat-containing protein [Bacillus alveayuensis]